MPDKSLKLGSKINESNVTLGKGSENTNKIVLEISNTSDEEVTFAGLGKKGTVSLTVFVGTRAEDLVGTAEESAKITIDEPDDWEDKTYKKLDTQAVWSFRLPRQVFQPGESKTVTLRNFISCTDPGKAKIKIGASISGYESYEETLEVEKMAETFRILYFQAEPPYIISDKDKNDFTLQWNTIQAGRVVLYKNESELETFTADVADFKNGEKYLYRKDSPDLASNLYKLVATDQADQKRDEQLITVHVLQSGWHVVDFRRRYGYPVVLVSMNQIKLYGIFIKDGKPSLCSSKHPYSVWDLENNNVPEKMATSPGVCFDNKLWLVGGSSVDPDNFSNQFLSYDVEEGLWSDSNPRAPWKSRMGHACVVFRDKLWVMGGMDENGNALRDVHSLDSNGNWETHENAEWEPRCMFAATTFGDRIWIYGGVAEPFGDSKVDLWTSEDGEEWRPYPTKIPQEVGKPISCTLQEVNGQLNLLGSFRKDQSVRDFKLELNEDQEIWSVNPIANGWDPQGQNTHSLLSVEYKGLVFLRSLNYEIYDNPTKLYIYLP